MAQPVFDDHPLEEYFRQAGEIAEDMPGALTDVLAGTPHDDGLGSSGPDAILDPFKGSWILSRGVQAMNACISSSSSDPQFTERFKYDVISSSLLSTALSNTPRSGSVQCRLPNETSASADDSHETQVRNGLVTSRWPPALVSVAIVTLSAEYYFVALFLFIAAFAYYQLAKSRASRVSTMNSTVTALNELIAAGNVWDSAINQAMSIVEKEERRPNSFYGPTSPQSPFSPLRVTLQSSLHTTQHQSDNVRKLLSALTSPTQASQLSEMYAPSSPPSAPSILQLEQIHPRPVSDPVANWRRRTSSETTYNKRATWNGSYIALAQASKSSLGTRRLDKRHSNLSTGFTTPATQNIFPIMSAPTSPSSLSKLVEVQEELGASDDDEYPIPELSSEYFGMAALDLRRKRQSAGLSALRMSRPPSYTNHAAVPMQSTLSLPAASRFTQGQTSRHPLSVSALRLALHGALSAKRYACSHLLALRFEDDDVTYWEDVRSMMALLTTTFSDASARLTEALDESETKRLKDERPSPSDSPSKITPSKSMQEMVGFAPMPNHLTRFATHVDAISTALDDARAHLEQCVASLRDPLKRDASADPFLDEDTSPIPPTESPVLQAYDRLRKELGFALRECERGREHLLHTIMPPSSNLAHLTDGEDEGDNVPSLVPDTATSDGGASAASFNQLAPTVLSVIEPDNGLGLNVAPDDATEHLLMSTSTQHLPPPGVEQVYEADSGIAGVFTREKSKMSREERIKLAKEKRRESSGTAFPSGQDSFVAPVRWAPEGEVVQELKDVIWKVSEKRRRMSEQVKASAGAAVSHATGVADAEGLSAPPLTEDVDAEADVVFSVTVDPVSSSDDAQSSSDFPTYPHLAAAALESSIHEDVQLAYLDS